MSAELAARRTAAAAVLADYTNAPGTADPAELSLTAARLASMLGLLLAELDAVTPPGGPAALQQLAAPEVRLPADQLEQLAELIRRGQRPE